MAAFTAIAGATMALGSAVSSGVRAGKMRRQASNRAAELRNLEANRQDIINPYEDIKDLSSMITNPFANLQVATKAAEMQAEEADISLASTLDTLRATGAGSAGATALAQAALKSKQGIAATIEQQEAQNARLRAQGEQQAQMARMGEMARIQSAQASGKQFMFQTREQREMQQLNRIAGLQAQATAGAQAAQAGMYGALGSLGGQLIGLSSGNNNASGGNNTPTYTRTQLDNTFKVTNSDFTSSPSRTGLPGAGVYTPLTPKPR